MSHCPYLGCQNRRLRAGAFGLLMFAMQGAFQARFVSCRRICHSGVSVYFTLEQMSYNFHLGFTRAVHGVPYLLVSL